MRVFPGLLALAGLGLLSCQPTAQDVVPEPSTPVASSIATIETPAPPGALAPELTTGPRGVWLSWLEREADAEPKRHVLRAARWDGADWSEAVVVAAGEGFFANWADRPAVVELADGTLYAHWLRQLGAGTYAYGIEIARSADGGASWDVLGWLHDDTTPSEHGFVSWLAEGDGVRAVWLDGRAMIEEGGGMHLRTAVLGPDASAAPSSVLLDDRTCECCATDAALTSRGPVVAYRDRSAEEIRDIAVVRLGEGAVAAATVHDDGWEIMGCPVNGPAVAARDDRLVVAWYTGADPGARVLVAFSDDAGATFGAPILVDDHTVGRVDVLLQDDGAVVSWLGDGESGGAVRVRRVTPDGELGEPVTVGTTSVARSAGVPRMVQYEDRIVLAWIEDGEPSRLRMARASL